MNHPLRAGSASNLAAQACQSAYDHSDAKLTGSGPLGVVAGPLESAIMSADTSLNELAYAVTQLEQRAATVLRPVPAAPMSAGQGESPTVNSLAVSGVQHLRARIEVLIAHVNGLADRIEA